MIIKCQECAHDNQMGAIFCRECGAKLDMEAIKPKSDKKLKFNIVAIIRKIITAVILLFLIYVLGSMFFPESTTNTILSEDDSIKASEKFEAMVNRMDGRFGDKVYSFTPDEITYLYNNKMTEDYNEVSASYSIENMYFTLDSKNFIHIMIQSKLFGKIPATFSLRGSIIDNSNQFIVLSSKMGHLSVPKFLQSKIVDKFKPGLNEGVIKKIIDSSKRFEVVNGDLVVTVKNK